MEIDHERRKDDRPTGRRSAAAVRTEDVQHPLDRQALAALKNVPGLDDLIRFLFEKGFEKVFRIQNLSSAVRVGPAHFPGLYDMYRGVVERLGVHPVPPLYVRGGPLNAWTTGVEEPFIVLTSAMVNITTPAELEYVIGHELGHIRCQHVLYNTLANNLALLTRFVPVAGRLLSAGLELSLMEWHRRAELSCDRFGLLGSQAPDAALRVMVKMAGAPYVLYPQIDIEAFLQQYEDFQKLDADGLSFFYRLASEAQLSHPWMVERAALARAWVVDGHLERLLAGAPVEDPPPPRSAEWAAVGRVCGGCGAPLSAGAAFCESCGAPATHARFVRACPRCGAANNHDDRFCDQCGGELGGAR
jgi:Zn-dependent protease with chaperone function